MADALPVDPSASCISGGLEQTPSIVLDPSVWTAWLASCEAAVSGEPLADVNRYRALLLEMLRARTQSRQLLVDVSEIARVDYGGGIQRVTNRLLGELLFAPPTGYRVEPVRVSDEGVYVYARRFLAGYLGLSVDGLGEDRTVQLHANDHFLGLDLIRDRAELARPAILAMRERGVSVSYVIYDLLPYTHPQWFPPTIDTGYNQWLHLVAETADIALCISQSVCVDLEAALAEMHVQRKPPAIASFPLGADFAGWTPQAPVLGCPPPGIARFLMVGTVERRKGHRVALDAFEALWAEGIEVELVIAGKPGWLVEPLLQRLRHLRGTGKLHWFEDVDDRTLATLYRESTALLAPAEGEGYGLPLVEAAWNDIPILARDIPVFREVAGDRAVYFTGGSDALAQSLQVWLGRWSGGELVTREANVCLWAHSAQALKGALEKQGVLR